MDRLDELEQKEDTLTDLEAYIYELYKDLHIYLNHSKRTLEQVCYDLMQMIKE